jgi:D-aminopeptidase
VTVSLGSQASGATVRARDLGIAVGPLAPGPSNAITDVPGVRVGHTTIVRGEGRLVVGEGPVRTGVTVIIPHDENPWDVAVFAGAHRLNGNGELTGLEWIRETGLLQSPIALTNTHSVGIVRDALIAEEVARRPQGEVFWGLPVVGETWDGLLNDINGFHVERHHVTAAVNNARSGAVAEGSVGGGTGMVCFGFKGGIGSSSRTLSVDGNSRHLGVLVQANHGVRERFRVNGLAVGELINHTAVPLPSDPASPTAGSIIGVIATDVPLIPPQLDRLAQRAALGVARGGGAGEHLSGDLFLAFSTANKVRVRDVGAQSASAVYDAATLDSLFYAVIDATEEAILNAMLAAETMVGRDGVSVHALDHDLLMAAIGEGRR